MKRPPGLWLLLSAGVLWLHVQNINAVKATSLIFGKTTTTTGSPEGAEGNNENPPEVGEVSVSSTTESGTPNVTKPTLTGIPQIDYIWDPNLPRELNGYNLSEYPFYDRVPEDIDFKCDGLHDGFYASVPHKCQVYHHCLFGTRYDFLCANYTAFDQKTFICHFVSEVDCVNSKKFWHRNDALYQSASTTTVKPVIIYTPPPQPPPVLAPSAPAPAPPAPRRPLEPRRQRPPLRRRRPQQYDYYGDYEYDDDDYEEPPLVTGRRNRPRARPRPIYDDEYEEYEEERIERRRQNRRPYDRRGYDRPYRRRNKNDRRNYDDEDDLYEDEPPRYNRRGEGSKNSGDEGQRPKNKRPLDEKRYNHRDADDDLEYERPNKRRRRPIDDYYEDERPLKSDRRRNHDEERNAKPVQDNTPIIKPTSGTSVYDRPRAAPKIRPPVPKNAQDKFAYKPVAAPSTESKHKDVVEEEYYDDYEEEAPVARKPTAAANRKPEANDSKRPASKARDEQPKETPKQEGAPSRPRGYSSKRPDDDLYEDTGRPNLKRPLKRPKYNSDGRFAPSGNRKRPVVEDYYEEEYEDEAKTIKPLPELPLEEDKPLRSKHSTTEQPAVSSTTKATTTTIASTTVVTDSPTTKELRPEHVVRIVKRPFLPSRGGNPYAARGLQPVGIKATTEKEKKVETTEAPSTKHHPKTEVSQQTTVSITPAVLKYKKTEYSMTHTSHSEPETPVTEEEERGGHEAELDEPAPATEEDEEKPKEQEKPAFRPSPVLLNDPERQSEEEEEFRPVSNRPLPVVKQNQVATDNGQPQTSEKPTEQNAVDINENEYDVTLNEALNPTLPNLPIRAFPSGFGSASELSIRHLQRPRYVNSGGLARESSEYNYQTKTPPQRFEAIPVYNSGGAQFANTNADYSGQFSHVSPSYRQSPRITQARYFSTSY